jgi:hypothetical protein
MHSKILTVLSLGLSFKIFDFWFSLYIISKLSSFFVRLLFEFWIFFQFSTPLCIFNLIFLRFFSQFQQKSTNLFLLLAHPQPMFHQNKKKTVVEPEGYCKEDFR